MIPSLEKVILRKALNMKDAHFNIDIHMDVLSDSWWALTTFNTQCSHLDLLPLPPGSLPRYFCSSSPYQVWWLPCFPLSPWLASCCQDTSRSLWVNFINVFYSYLPWVSVNSQKSVPTPKQTLDFIGVSLNSITARAYLPRDSVVRQSGPTHQKYWGRTGSIKGGPCSSVGHGPGKGVDVSSREMYHTLHKPPITSYSPLWNVPGFPGLLKMMGNTSADAMSLLVLMMWQNDAF